MTGIPFRDRPIRQKVRLLTMVIIFGVGLLVASSRVVEEYFDMHTEAREKMTSLAGVIGRGSVAGVSFNYPKEVEKELALLSTVPNITSAVIYLPDGKKFAAYNRGASSEKELESIFVNDPRSLIQPILLEGEPIGRIEIKWELGEKYRGLFWYLLIVVAITAILAILSLLLFDRLLRTVTDSIALLSRSTGEIGRGNLSQKIEVTSKDEVGLLAASFSKMTEDLMKITVSRDELIKEIEEREKAEEETKRINRELQDFAHVVSHDLKSPLLAISRLAHWLSEDSSDKLDDAGRELLMLIQQRSSRMFDMIDGILRYSKIGRIKGTPEQVHTGKIAAQMIKAISPPAGIRFIVHASMPVVSVDPIRISQVFQNLIGNAVKHMDKPEGLIEIGAGNLNGFHEFFVKDNGPGIDEKHFERIFQIFQTLKKSDEIDSTGVGLTIARKIVEQNGGRIWVESELGKGSAFRFTLPQ